MPNKNLHLSPAIISRLGELANASRYIENTVRQNFDRVAIALRMLRDTGLSDAEIADRLKSRIPVNIPTGEREALDCLGVEIANGNTYVEQMLSGDR